MRSWPRNPYAARRTRGFSLVELMIALALGLLIMVALIAVYLNVSRTHTEMAKTNSLIENGRFAIDIVHEDLVHAGFWGGYVPDFDDLSVTTVPVTTPTASPDPCLAYFDGSGNENWTPEHKNNLIGIPVQVFGDVPGTCGSLISSRKANTDIVVVRHASNACVPGVGSCPAADAGQVMFQASRCYDQIMAGRAYVLSNNDPVLNPNTTQPDLNLDLTQMDCATLAAARAYISDIYYLRDYAVTAGDGVPTLMRSTFDVASGKPVQSAAVPLIEGIEGFVVELGVDAQSRCGTAVDYDTATVIPPAPATATAIQRVDPATCSVDVDNPGRNTLPPNRGDGVPESYVHCTGNLGCTVAQLRNAVSAKIFVLARSKEATAGYTDRKTYKLGSVALGPFNDGFKRHVFQMAARLSNVSGRRGTP